MKAIFTGNFANARNMAQEKETISKYVVIGTINKERREIVDARVYMGRSSAASTVYCSIWVHGRDKTGAEIHTAGRGTASGYGYHKESAAIASAISSAGIELFGQTYADENGMFYAEIPNTAWRAFADRTPEEQEMRNYEWRTPKYIRQLRRENAKDFKNRVHFGGVGDSATRAALLAIARAAGGKDLFIVQL